MVGKTEVYGQKEKVASDYGEVKLLSFTANPEEVIFASARQCYSTLSGWEIYERAEEVSPEKKKKMIELLLKRGHLSPLEHVSFTFSISGISRVCTHQLVRHRIASFSQQSQRYVNMEKFGAIIPPLIYKNEKARQIFLETVEEIKKRYKQLKEILSQEAGLRGEKLHQDLRFILPQAVETKIVVTMNARQLLHFFSERLCYRAQWEIRNVADKMVSLCRQVLPSVFNWAGPKCKKLGYCPENYTTCPLYSPP